MKQELKNFINDVEKGALEGAGLVLSIATLYVGIISFGLFVGASTTMATCIAMGMSAVAGAGGACVTWMGKRSLKLKRLEGDNVSMPEVVSAIGACILAYSALSYGQPLVKAFEAAAKPGAETVTYTYDDVSITLPKLHFKTETP